jgi:hypothetical protein
MMQVKVLSNVRTRFSALTGEELLREVRSRSECSELELELAAHLEAALDAAEKPPTVGPPLGKKEFDTYVDELVTEFVRTEAGVDS